MLSKIVRIGLSVAAMALVASTCALAETTAAPASVSITVAQTTPADFGSPPSGQVPILYNDRHVYAKPNVLKQGRVLAALVRNGTVLIPLRSMFEQMGATVSYDPVSKTADVSKEGADVKVTVGQPEVVINGESRPLDVAPIVYKGQVLVPIRVISEGMGAFVQWVPDQRVVVVRYLPATPPPPPATEAPPPPPTAAPAPTAAPTAPPLPNPFTYRGYVRAYDFYRQNAYSAYGKAGPGSKANQNSENNAISLHGDYTFQPTGLSIGASYLYANPLNDCADPSKHASTVGPPCGTKSEPPGLNPDDTLPGFELSTLYEAYLQYKANGWYFKGGNQVINTPWAPSSDSRLKPVAYQGADASYTLASDWTLEAADFWQWECRTCSDFDRGTLLTAINPGGYTYSGASGYPTNFYNPTETTYDNNGFEYGRLGYAGPASAPLAANAYYYAFSDIATAWWFDAKYPFAGPLRPFIAAQGGVERNAGESLLGTINSEILGLQVGFNPLHDVTLTGGFDTIPIKTATIVLPTGFKCSKTHTISSPSGFKGDLPYFLPTSGTGNCSPAAGGLTNIYYGGWASPYTDTYATDPLFTTSGTQGMVDRRSPGTSFKVAATFTSDNKQFVLMLAQSYYDYNNGAYAQSTTGTDVDTQYFFSHIPKSGPYKGFDVRIRLFSRSETTFPGGSAVGLFKYSRFQAEYNF